MAALDNARYERYAQNLIRGMSQRDAYRDAFPRSVGWKDRTVDVRASELYNQPAVQERIKELQEAAASEAVATRQERMEILSEVARSDKQLPKYRMQAIDILNKMDNLYVRRVEASVHEDLSGTAAKVAEILDE